MMVFGLELPPEVFGLIAGLFMFLLTVGTGMAAWALRELVRLTNAVTKIEQMVAQLSEERVDHDRRIAALEVHRWGHE